MASPMKGKAESKLKEEDEILFESTCQIEEENKGKEEKKKDPLYPYK